MVNVCWRSVFVESWGEGKYRSDGYGRIFRVLVAVAVRGALLYLNVGCWFSGIWNSASAGCDAIELMS